MIPTDFKLDNTMFNNRTLIKPEMSLADRSSANLPNGESQQPQQQQPNFPEWINEFNKQCLKICGTRCSEKLDEIMETYIQEIKNEMFLCDSSPNRASLIANRMSKTLMFFYLYYTDIKEFFVISQWNENISVLLLFYCRLELKAAHRVHRGKDSDNLVCSRIMNALWIYLNFNYEAMLHVILQIPQIGRRHKDILDPIFRKLLMNKKQKPLTELEYIKNLLAFKLWKRLYGKEDKKAISHLALTELRPPRSFLGNYKKYKFLPACPHDIDIHTQFVTGLIDLESAIKEYVEIYNKTKRTDYHPTEKNTSFISDFCSSFGALDNSQDDMTDSYMLDKVKNENDIQEIEDDDCIIVDDLTETPPVIQRIVPPDPTEVIDLTADEPEIQIITETVEDEVPAWCKELIKQSEELKITPPPSPKVEIPTEIVKEPHIDTEISQQEIIQTVIRETTPIRESSTQAEIIMPKIEIETPRKENIPPSPPPLPSTPPPQRSIEVNVITEDNSIGLTEITSTSHPVKDFAQDPADSSVFNLAETFAEQSAKEVYSENFEHVDSTSNLNEEEIDIDVETDEPTFDEPSHDEPSHDEPSHDEPSHDEPSHDEPSNDEPTIKTFVVERTVEDGIVRSEIISEVSPESEINEEDLSSEHTVSTVSNIEFEQFAAQNVTKALKNGIIISHISGKNNNIVGTSRHTSDSDDFAEDILDDDLSHIDHLSDNNNTEAHLLIAKEPENHLFYKESEGNLLLNKESEGFISNQLLLDKKVESNLIIDRESEGSIYNHLLIDKESASSIHNQLQINKETEGSIHNQLQINKESEGSIPNQLQINKESEGSIPNQLQINKESEGFINNHLLIDKESESSIQNQLQVDKESEGSSRQLLIDKESEGSIHSQHEIDDFTSPAIEPLPENDFANYLAGMDGTMFEEFNKNSELINGDLLVIKKRKMEENPVRTYTKKSHKLDVVIDSPVTFISEPEILLPPEPPKERRVPVNGERVRFEDVLESRLESIYSNTFKLSQKEYSLFLPTVLCKKEDPKSWIPNYLRFESTLEGNEEGSAVEGPFNVDELYFGGSTSAKKILERQDYLKSKKAAEVPRARVTRRPVPTVTITPALKDQKSPDVVTQKTKRRGPRKQATTEVVKKRKVGRRKSTRLPAASSPAPNPVEQIPETTPWRFSVS